MKAYFQFLGENKWNWLVLLVSLVIFAFQTYGLVMRWKGKSTFFVQRLDRFRQVCLYFIKSLIPLGIGASLVSLMNLATPAAAATAKTLGNPFFQEHFGMALSPALTGIISYLLNLMLNLVLWFNCAGFEKDAG